MFPKCENAFIADLIVSVQRRRKAIAYRVRVLRCDKVIERNGDVEQEKLEIELHVRASARVCVVRLFIWEDRWVFVDARVGSKHGWKWEWTRKGKLLGSVNGRSLAEALERTIDFAPSMSTAETHLLDGVWIRMFGAEPRLVSR